MGTSHTVPARYESVFHESHAVEDDELRRLYENVRKERAVGAESSIFRRLFKRDLHTTLVNNLGRIGLLTERMSPRLEALGIRPAPTA